MTWRSVMNNFDIFSILPALIIGFVLLIVLLVILRRIFVNVGAREIAIKERRYLGRRMPPGRVVATEGEVGIQAEVLKPGLHLIKYPFERVVRKVPLIEIGADELGIAAFWSPDNKKIAFTSDRDGNSEVYVMNADGKNVRRLTNTRATERAAVWSPDGKRIVFSSDGDGPSEIYVMDADGSNLVCLTRNSTK